MGTTLGLYVDAGPTLFLLVLVGIAGLGVLLERFYVIVLRSTNNGRAFVERIMQLVRAEKIDDAIKACAASTAPLPDVGLLILRSRSRNEAELQTLAAAAAMHVLPRLTRRLGYLNALSLTAVLLGGFGAARGVQSAFAAAAVAGQRASTFWIALANAMTPIELGLAIAIVLLLARSYLAAHAERVTELTREFSVRLINALLDRPDVRLGHR
jgi:biopolymer transport protein ExbB/TolQ